MAKLTEGDISVVETPSKKGSRAGKNVEEKKNKSLIGSPLLERGGGQERYPRSVGVKIPSSEGGCGQVWQKLTDIGKRIYPGQNRSHKGSLDKMHGTHAKE